MKVFTKLILWAISISLVVGLFFLTSKGADYDDRVSNWADNISEGKVTIKLKNDIASDVIKEINNKENIADVNIKKSPEETTVIVTFKK